jgi:hypothetical protein
MSIYTCGETYVHRLLIRDRNNTTVYPDDGGTVYFNLYDRCGNQLVTNGSMATDATGYYQYTYAIPANCVYGEYTIQVVATDAAGDVQTFDDNFFIFPWNITNQVRRFSGIKTKKSMSDNDIAELIWEAYNEALDEVYELHSNDVPKCNPDTREWFNGTNTTFETAHAPIADADGDGVIRGYGEASCGTDIDGWWKDSDGNCHRVNVTVNDAHCGNITITQLDGTAIPSDCKWVRLNYRTEWHTYKERIFRFAVAYLAAYKCIESFKALDKANLADLNSNQKDLYLSKNRMKKQYKKALRKVKKPLVGAGMIPGEN